MKRSKAAKGKDSGSQAGEEVSLSDSVRRVCADISRSGGSFDIPIFVKTDRSSLSSLRQVASAHSTSTSQLTILEQRKAANPKKIRANGDAALRQEAVQHALEAGFNAAGGTSKPNPVPGQQSSAFGDSIVQQQVQSLMQLNSSLSSRIRHLESEVEGLKRQMKDKEDKDSKKEEWFPSLVTFIVRNLNSKTDSPLYPVRLTDENVQI